jgi:hypothetical protein
MTVMTENPPFLVSIRNINMIREQAYGSAPTVSRMGLVKVVDELDEL